MDNDTTEFPMIAAIQPGHSGGPVLDGAGALLGVTVPRMNDVAALMATNSVPQTVNFGIKGDVAASFLRVNGVEPKTSEEAAALTTPQIAAGGKAGSIKKPHYTLTYPLRSACNVSTLPKKNRSAIS